MSNIQQKKYKNEDFIGSENYCMICMNEYEEGETVSILPCNKEFLLNFFFIIERFQKVIFSMKIAFKNG